jgi:hypothetical protein
VTFSQGILVNLTYLCPPLPESPYSPRCLLGAASFSHPWAGGLLECCDFLSIAHWLFPWSAAEEWKHPSRGPIKWLRGHLRSLNDLVLKGLCGESSVCLSHIQGR